MLIPNDAKPHEVGIYIAYFCLGVKNPVELQDMFHYQSRTSVDKVLKRLRARMRQQESSL